MLANPNYRTTIPTLTRNRTTDKAALQALIDGWPSADAEITTHALADAWLATLSASAVAAIQAAYPSGVGAYVESVLAS